MSTRSHMLAAMVMAIAPVWAFAAPPPGAASCLGCHAAAGTDSPVVVSLSALKAEQIETAMQAFRAGTRPATVMDRIAKGFSDEEVRAIAQWYAGARSK